MLINRDYEVDPLSCPRCGTEMAVVAASVAQEETLAFFKDRLKDIDLEKLRKRVLRFMKATRPGPAPTTEQLNQAIGGTISK